MVAESRSPSDGMGERRTDRRACAADNIMQLDLSGSFFELFGFSEGYAIDEGILVKRFRDMQSQLHPDKFASRPDSERRWSMQAASVVNEAYQTLSNELGRAAYLLKVNGISIGEETDTKMDPMFLMEQMDLRESLEIAEAAEDPFSALGKIREQLRSSIDIQKQAFASAAAEHNWNEARTITRQWQFLDKLVREAKSLEERLDS